MDDVKRLSDRQLQEKLDKIFDVWELNNEVFSMSDLCELVREQTKREYNVYQEVRNVRL